MKHISHPKHRTNLLAGLTLIFLFKKMLCIGYFKCNAVSLSKKEGKLGAKGKKNQSLNFSNLFSTQVRFNELQQFQLTGAPWSR